MPSNLWYYSCEFDSILSDGQLANSVMVFDHLRQALANQSKFEIFVQRNRKPNKICSQSGMSSQSNHDPSIHSVYHLAVWNLANMGCSRCDCPSGTTPNLQGSYRPIPISIGPQLESRPRRYQCWGRAITHVRRNSWSSRRNIWLRRRQQPSRRWTRTLLWDQADSWRLSRSWLVSTKANWCLSWDWKLLIFSFSFNPFQSCVLFARSSRIVFCHVVLPSSNVEIFIEAGFQVVVPFLFVQPFQVEIDKTLVLLREGKNHDIIKVCLANSFHKVGKCE